MQKGVTLPSQIITCDAATVTNALDQAGLAACLGKNFQLSAHWLLQAAGVNLRSNALDIGGRDLRECMF